MVRRYKTTIFIDKDPDDPFKGWGWVDVDQDVAQRLKISTEHPRRRELPPEKLEEFRLKGKTCTTCIHPPSRGKAGGKKLIINTDNEIIHLSVQKSLTAKAVCHWVKSWASANAQITTPGNRIISLEGEPLSKASAFVYFVLNSDSNAIKIGKALNVEKRLKSLQTVSPAKLQLLRVVQVTSEEEARILESSLHQKFATLRITGEWFRAEKELFDYLEICS